MRSGKFAECILISVKIGYGETGERRKDVKDGSVKRADAAEV